MGGYRLPQRCRHTLPLSCPIERAHQLITHVSRAGYAHGPSGTLAARRLLDVTMGADHSRDASQTRHDGAIATRACSHHRAKTRSLGRCFLAPPLASLQPFRGFSCHPLRRRFSGAMTPNSNGSPLPVRRAPSGSRRRRVTSFGKSSRRRSSAGPRGYRWTRQVGSPSSRPSRRHL